MNFKELRLVRQLIIVLISKEQKINFKEMRLNFDQMEQFRRPGLNSDEIINFLNERFHYGLVESKEYQVKNN